MLNALIVIKQCLLRLLVINKLLKYTKIWERVSSLMNIEFDSEPVDDNDNDDNDKYIKKESNMEIK